jgi:hypothetical protein
MTKLRKTIFALVVSGLVGSAFFTPQAQATKPGSGISAVPDGGATVALLGLALAGIEGMRRKLKRDKQDD